MTDLTDEEINDQIEAAYETLRLRAPIFNFASAVVQKLDTRHR
jgi:hypothetical protein